MTQLGVNVDHVATVRNARGGMEPDPVTAAGIAEINGADSIVCHLREDRRHIVDRDLALLSNTVATSLQLEMALDPKIVEIALATHPAEVMIVPERRQEVTTEGGFDCIKHQRKFRPVIEKFHAAGIGVSVFLDPDLKQIEKAAKLGVGIVELHTGPYSHARGFAAIEDELERLEAAALKVLDLGLVCHAGHGLNYHNITELLRRVPVEKVNIGHSIISRAVFKGLGEAVREMKELVSAATIDL